MKADIMEQWADLTVALKAESDPHKACDIRDQIIGIMKSVFPEAFAPRRRDIGSVTQVFCFGW